ncbi:glycosyltransferase [Halalkalirubrum salinum]|uniref:glycosyltransferase n=1 Tax=Halalkalirubrum salinum TaxID=2563889 RepID=UPI0010FB77A9|nr:glycosyltransferase family 2 protein [Halalkalirubrum salinum]
MSVVGRVAERSGFVLASLLVLAFGFVSGVRYEELTLDLLLITVRVAMLDAASAAIVFSGFVVLSGGLLFREIRRDRAADPIREDGPPITAIVPVYKDGDVLSRSVESLIDSTYRNLSIVVVGEPDDDETMAVAEEYANRYDDVIACTNRYPGSKAGAIQTAVERSEAAAFAIFDADEVVDPSFIAAGAYAVFDDGYGVFQGRRIPEPTGLVETLAYCERAAFHASYKLIEPTGFYNCRSSSTIVSRDAYETVDGYDDLLTEDLAFAHKCFRHGIEVNQSRNHTNLMEAPHSLSDFWGQRKRWRTGQVEVLHETIRGTLTGGTCRRRLLSFGRLASSLVGSLFTLVIASKLLVLILAGAEIFFLLPAAAIVLTMAAIALVDYRAGQIQYPPGVVLSPLVYPVFGLLTVKSALVYALSWDGSWYRVEKKGA